MEQGHPVHRASRVLSVQAGQRGPARATTGTPGGLALPAVRLALWRSGPADSPRPAAAGGGNKAAATYGGCRPCAPVRAPPAVTPGRGSGDLGRKVEAPRMVSAIAAQFRLPDTLFRRRATTHHRAAVRMKDVVVVFARAPRLGTVKRRLARDIGD